MGSNQCQLHRLQKEFSIGHYARNATNITGDVLVHINDFIEASENFNNTYKSARNLELKSRELSKEISDYIKGTKDVIFDSFNENSEFTNNTASDASLYVIIAIVISVILSVLFTTFISRSIRLPIIEKINMTSLIMVTMKFNNRQSSN